LIWLTGKGNPEGNYWGGPRLILQSLFCKRDNYRGAWKDRYLSGKRWYQDKRSKESENNKEG